MLCIYIMPAPSHRVQNKSHKPVASDGFWVENREAFGLRQSPAAFPFCCERQGTVVNLPTIVAKSESAQG
jgi:hypothetical protein